MRFQSLVATVVLGLALSGCQSYDIVQSNIFSNDDGYAVRIDYGRSGSDHVNTFENPATGKETEFRSRLVVKVHLPDGDVFTAWQCMNFLRSGTMYKTDDGAWLVLVNLHGLRGGSDRPGPRTVPRGLPGHSLRIAEERLPPQSEMAQAYKGRFRTMEMNPLDNIRVVLVGTLYTGNVGSSCRAMPM